jgi:hypothetical protein
VTLYEMYTKVEADLKEKFGTLLTSVRIEFEGEVGGRIKIAVTAEWTGFTDQPRPLAAEDFEFEWGRLREVDQSIRCDPPGGIVVSGIWRDTRMYVVLAKVGS